MVGISPPPAGALDQAAVPRGGRLSPTAPRALAHRDTSPPRLERPLSAREWYAASLSRKREDSQGRAAARRPASARPASARPASPRPRAVRIEGDDLRAPLPDRFMTPTPPPWASTRPPPSAEEKARKRLRKRLAPQIERAMGPATTAGLSHRSRLRSLFRKLDQNGDGVLSLDELRDGLAQMKPPLPLTRKQVEKIITQIDAEGEGAVSWLKFAAAFGLPEDNQPAPEPPPEPKPTAAASTGSNPREQICTMTSPGAMVPTSAREISRGGPTPAWRGFLRKGEGRRADVAAPNQKDTGIGGLDGGAFGDPVTPYAAFGHRDVDPTKWSATALLLNLHSIRLADREPGC